MKMITYIRANKIKSSRSVRHFVLKNSNKETAMQQCAASLMMIVAGMLNENTEFCRYYLDNPDFMAAINQRVFESVYNRHCEEKKGVAEVYDLQETKEGIPDKCR